ncbi:hypothetical protein SteCoe_17739 [Stentor coeruleus]|uniref:Uncharacterized protein n=1 Tax=Stentor coeruleus TaxID=5963 RepID=A0A1R2BYP2_9CILI|nr:hypothetical protein SteCoe_17739 [Stentor coeruleus]
MGNCTNASMNPHALQAIPDLYYLDRRNQQVLFISKNQSTKIDFSKTISFYENSSIIYLSASEFLIAGGRKPSQKLSKKVFRVNSLLKKTYIQPSLPFPAYGGNLIYNKGNIYLSSAITEQNGSDYPCPLLKYCLNEQTWEVCDVSDLHLNAKYSLNNILYSQSCLHDHKIFTMSGKLLSTGTLTRKIFSINLSNSSFRVNLEPFKLPEKFRNVRCCSTGKVFMICGEQVSADKSVIYTYSFETKTWKLLDEVLGLFSEIYPSLIISSKIVFLSYPYVVVRDLVKTHVFNFEEENKKQKGHLSVPSGSSDSVNRSKSFDVRQHAESEETKLKNLGDPLEKAPRQKSMHHEYEKVRRHNMKKSEKKITAKYLKCSAPFLPSNILGARSLNSSSSHSSSSESISSSNSSKT